MSSAQIPRIFGYTKASLISLAVAPRNGWTNGDVAIGRRAGNLLLRCPLCKNGKAMPRSSGYNNSPT